MNNGEVMRNQVRGVIMEKTREAKAVDRNLFRGEVIFRRLVNLRPGGCKLKIFGAENYYLHIWTVLPQIFI